MAAAHDHDPIDPTRVDLLELGDAPTKATTTPKAPAPAITAAPAPAPSLHTQGAVLLCAADTLPALKAAGQAVNALQGMPADRNHPLRNALREVYRARVLVLVGAMVIVWHRMWSELATAIAARPHVWTADGLPHSLAEGTTSGRLVSVPEGLLTPAHPVAVEATLASHLTEIGAEGAAVAAAPAAGSMADGTMRGVGYTDAAGYVRALAQGTKEPTTSQYLSILRSTYGYTPEQIAGLTIGGIVSSALPVGAGIVHVAEGPSVFEQQAEVLAAARAAARAAADVIRAEADAGTIALAQRLVVTDSPLAWWEIGWSGVGNLTRATVLDACGGRAPKAKISSTQLARTVDGMRGTYDAAMVGTKAAGVKVRWQIGRGQQHAAYVGSEYGKVLAIVDLRTDGTLDFSGDAAIADEVREEFTRLTRDEVLRPGDITAWLSQTLRADYGAVRSGDRFLVSPEHKAGAQLLCHCLSKAWPTSHWVMGGLDADGVPQLGVTVLDVATVIGGIWQGIAAEVTEAEERWARTVALATDKVGATACRNELARIDGEGTDKGLTARVGGFTLIGEKPLAPLKARVAALRVLVTAALDAHTDTTQRAAMLELT